MRISLNDIHTFSKCPRYFSYLKDNIQVPKSKRLSILEKIIKRAYSRRTEYRRHSEWKTIIGWVDKEVFRNVDIEQADQFRAARRMSEDLLLFLDKWYRKYYIGDLYPVFMDIPVCFDYGSNIVAGEIPFVELGDKPKIIYFDETEYDTLRIYKDIRVMSWGCMLIEELDVDEVEVEHISIGNRSGLLTDRPAIIKKDRVKQLKETVREIAMNIAANVTYPSYTEMCQDCQFRRSCRL